MRVRGRRGHLLVMGCLLCVALAGCAGGNAGASPVHDGHETGSAAAPTALPTGGELETGCSDPTGDTAPAAGSGATDLSDVAIVSQGDTAVLAFTLAGPIPAKGQLILAVEARSKDGATVRQVGVKLQDGQPAGAFVGNSSGGEPQQLGDVVHIAGQAVHAAFPASTIKDLGESWRWYAVVGTAAGIDDLCPGGADTSLGTVGSIAVG